MSQNETWASLEQMPWTHSDPGCNRFFAFRDIRLKPSLRGQPLLGEKNSFRSFFLMFYYVTWHTKFTLLSAMLWFVLSASFLIDDSGILLNSQVDPCLQTKYP